MKVVSEFLSSPFCPVVADLAAGSSAGESTSLTFGQIDLWKVSFLEHCLKNSSSLQETVSLLNQCVGEENQGQLQNDKESKILTKDFKKQMK